MSVLPPWRGLYAILDLPHAGGLAPEVAARGLVGEGAGPRIVQLRAKGASEGELLEVARRVRSVMQGAGVRFIVDDDLEVALACGADGVHFGQEDMVRLAGGAAWSEVLLALRRRVGPGFMVGLSTHDLEQVRVSAGLGVDYIGFGPVFPTRSKANPEPCVGLDALGRACEISSCPVVAIGGIGGDEALACVRAGAAAVAMIGGLVGRSELEVRERAALLAEVLARGLDERSRPAGR